MPVYQGSRAKILITHPYNDWKHVSEKLQGHSILQYHKDSMTRFESFIVTTKNIEWRIENRANKNSEDSIKQNRKVLSSVIRAIEYCGRQGIGFRGHHNDDSNQGNFRELLKLMVGIDNNLDKHALVMLHIFQKPRRMSC